MIVLYSEEVEGDLDAIAEYIAADSHRRAVSFIREIYAAIERIGEGPLLYQLRPDIGPDARLAVVGRYVVLFRFAKDQLRDHFRPTAKQRLAALRMLFDWLVVGQIRG